MKTLTREKYLEEFKRKADSINSSKESALTFYNKIGVLTPTGRVSVNYKPGKAGSKPVRRK